MTPLLTIDKLEFRWPGDSEPTLAIRNFAIDTGEHVFLAGPSGSGKSTLLGLIGGVLEPGKGAISLLGTDLGQLGAAQRDRFRADHLGIVFQQFNLLPFLSLVDNVLLPCRFSKRRRQRATQQGKRLGDEAKRLLERMHLPIDTIVGTAAISRLSVGQQQRVALARALVGAPELIIADEPTSALDDKARDAFLELLFEQADTAGSTILLVSHDTRIAGHFPKRVSLTDLNRADVRC
ncbi:MAG: methionine ABC transporter ATP-binding protein [Gammaproteobacteria bacterium]|nr:MAG: methionine ABC transporter ATP-binding protein [Gammaproteobacteria bacterium]